MNKKRYFVWTDFDQSATTSLEFYIALDLSYLPTFCTDAQYLKENLHVTEKHVEIMEVEKFGKLKNSADDQLANDLGATHLIKLSTKNLVSENQIISINIFNKQPGWPASTDAGKDDKSRNKTFGLLPMLKGLNGSFEHKRFLFKDPLQILISKNSN